MLSRAIPKWIIIVENDDAVRRSEGLGKIEDVGGVVKFFELKPNSSRQLQTYENWIGPPYGLAIYRRKMDQTSGQNSGFPYA